MSIASVLENLSFLFFFKDFFPILFLIVWLFCKISLSKSKLGFNNDKFNFPGPSVKFRYKDCRYSLFIKTNFFNKSLIISKKSFLILFISFSDKKFRQKLHFRLNNLYTVFVY